jgi:Fe-S cluster assembly protein SufD
MATVVATPSDRLLDAFASREREGAFARPAWLASRRRAAIARFAEVGFPTTRDEDWRYTNLAKLIATPFRWAPADARAEISPATMQQLTIGADWPRLTFVDGRYVASFSDAARLTGGARLASLADAIAADDELVERHLTRHAGWDGNIFAALNTAFVEDGAVVVVPTDTSLAAPVELLFVAATPGVAVQPRILVVAEPGSHVTLVERYVSLTEAASFTNVVSELVVEAGATVDHYVVQEQGPRAFHVGSVHAAVERDASFSTCGVTLGAQLARTTLATEFRGERARGMLHGVYVLDGTQHVDHHVTVDHAVPRCTSRQLFKGILDGSARAVFNGRILVRQDAQKTDANQTNKHLLLSDGVEVDSKPQLEIFADDVKCTHGAAEGQLAPDALFYLRSRGLDESAARGLLTYGFAREVVDRIAPDELRAYVDRALTARLSPLMSEVA